MKISELSVRRPVTITMVFVLIIVVATLFLSNLSIALYPSVEYPIIGVMVSIDEDVDPEQVELQVAKKIENAVTSITGLNSMTSRASSSSCNVILEFEYGTDLDDAQSDVQNVINRLSSSLPDWANTPTVMQFDTSSSSSFMTLIISGPGTAEETYNVANDSAKPLFERIEGISQVTVYGGTSSVYKVIVDPIRLESYGLSIANVTSALSARNIQSSGGTLTQEGMNYQVTIDERFRTLEEIGKTTIKTIDGVQIKVEDVGEVVVEESTNSRRSYIDGEKVITLRLSNDSDTNSADVAKLVYASLDDINSELPTGYRLKVQRDNTSMISSTMNEVYNSAIMGVILAALIIFLFLRSFRTTFIIALSMPISILVTLACMSIMDITVNSMSMSGLILGIGMIVDASIVILENTVKFREQGRSCAASAILGSHNMTNAIMSSTLTTLCVFIPLIIYKGKLEMIGMMFQDLIYTVCISLVVSLFVALTLVPALSGSIMGISTRVQKPIKFAPLRAIDNFLAKIEDLLEVGYVKVLDYFLSHKLLLIVLLVLLLAFSLGQFSGVGMSLTPRMDTDDSVRMNLTFPAGTHKDVTQEELFKVYREILEVLPEEAYEYIMINAGSSNSGSIEICMPDIADQKYSVNDIKSICSPLLEGNPDAVWTYSAGRGPGSGSAINISVSSSDIDETLETVNEIASIIRTYVPEATNVNTDLTNGAPKISVVIDKDLASDLGVSLSNVSQILTYALSGKSATSLTTFSSDTTYSLKVTMDDSSMTNINSLGALLVPANDGYVRLDSIATFEIGTSPKSITREDKKRINHVTASAAAGLTSSEVQAAVDEALDAHLFVPEGVTVSQSGEMSDFAEYAPTLALIIVLALVLVYAVMAAQFESMIDPFIIFATIPLLLIGVVFIHLWMDQALSLFSIVGIIALIGVVVNNGIVMVDSINQLVRKKTKVREACLMAARTRLRPILMTTLTTILGMVPMAFFPGSGAEMMQPIALTFVGGLVTGAFLTLLLSPTLYMIFNKRREKRFDNPKSLMNQLSEFDAEFPTGRYDKA
ncbi:MAG: efflux RND transporter permease subunit [Sphaerochaetaceae bacterium]|nr:efflux RND transporter permease subunit [Sphaerochaetaceae bacterium]